MKILIVFLIVIVLIIITALIAVSLYKKLDRKEKNDIINKYVYSNLKMYNTTIAEKFLKLSRND